ncbi:MAG: xanthine dehydrogenase family protein subunit M [Solirubrobacterales bacterium]|nr:xanthine dehydrogenase family protein subunit M [Solirubrobacterales bacterium]
MIPARFDYVRAGSVDEAISALTEGGEDAKLLAGGHSLLPLMKLRLAAPSRLIDISGLDEIRGVQRQNGDWSIGGGTRHVQLQDAPEMGVISRAASLIADQQVRNRGTIGGSVAHGDPASDLPAVLLASESEIVARGRSGERRLAVGDLFQDYLTTALEPDELITEIRMPALEGYGWGYEKFIRRSEDWAMVGVCALVKQSDGVCEDVRIGLTHMSSTPLRASAVEEALRGQSLDADQIARAAEQAAEGTRPPGDLNATPDYKRHLARVLTKRALESAAGLGERGQR